jgi:hypothetical protein
VTPGTLQQMIGLQDSALAEAAAAAKASVHEALAGLPELQRLSVDVRNPYGCALEVGVEAGFQNDATAFLYAQRTRRRSLRCGIISPGAIPRVKLT